MNNTFMTTLILIRHGEKDNSNPDDQDPHLSEAGERRARTLIHILGQTDISAIYTSTCKRTRETAAPLEHYLGIQRTEIDDALTIKEDIFAKHAGEKILVIGHTDTVPELINQVGGEKMPYINDLEFDNLFVVTIHSPGKASVIKIKY